MSRESKLKEQHSHKIDKLNRALKSARDLLLLCALIDKSGQCEKEVEKIDKILGI